MPHDVIDAEAADLRVHVQLCALRHVEVRERIVEVKDRIGRLEKAVWGVLALVGTGTLFGNTGLKLGDLIGIARAFGGH